MTARLANDAPAIPLHDRPAVELAYLVFVFLPLVFWPRYPWSAVWVSVAASAAFVPLHFAFYREPQQRRGLILVIAALGFALIPFNPGGNAFVIYASAMAGHVLRPRHAIGLTVALLAAMTSEYFLVLPTVALAAGY